MPEETSGRQRRARTIRLLIGLVLIAVLGVLAWTITATSGSKAAASRPPTLTVSPIATIQTSPTAARSLVSVATATSRATTTPTATSTPAPAYVDELYLATATATSTSGPDLAAAVERIPTSFLYIVRHPSYVNLASSGEDRLPKYAAVGDDRQPGYVAVGEDRRPRYVAVGEDRLPKYVAVSEASAPPAVAVIPGETSLAPSTPTSLPSATVAPTPDTATPLAPATASPTPDAATPLVPATVSPTPNTAPVSRPAPSPTPFTTVIYAAGTNITIPRLNVVAPVYEGGVGYDGAPVIANGYALTHFYWSAKAGQAGNMVLYGHDDIQGNIFANLPAMVVGDRIYIDTSGTLGKHRYIYQVTGSQIVLPNATWVMNPTTGPTITLLSCTPFNIDTQRIVVKGNLVEVDGRAVQVASGKKTPSGG